MPARAVGRGGRVVPAGSTGYARVASITLSGVAVGTARSPFPRAARPAPRRRGRTRAAPRPCARRGRARGGRRRPASPRAWPAGGAGGGGGGGRVGGLGGAALARAELVAGVPAGLCVGGQGRPGPAGAGAAA